MVNEVLVDRSKGELRIHGKRYLAMDVQALCNHLDSLVGPTVAEVIINNHEYRLGKLDAARFRHEQPAALIGEVIDSISENLLLSGVGITKVVIPENVDYEEPFSIGVQNPCVKATGGAGKALLLSYWCGVLASLFGQEFEAVDARFNERETLLTAKIVRRKTH